MRNQNYVTNKRIIEEVRKNQKDYVEIGDLGDEPETPPVNPETPPVNPDVGDLGDDPETPPADPETPPADPEVGDLGDEEPNGGVSEATGTGEGAQGDNGLDDDDEEGPIGNGPTMEEEEGEL